VCVRVRACVRVVRGVAAHEVLYQVSIRCALSGVYQVCVRVVRGVAAHEVLYQVSDLYIVYWNSYFAPKRCLKGA